MDFRRGFLSDGPKSKLNSTVDPAAGGEDDLRTRARLVKALTAAARHWA